MDYLRDRDPGTKLISRATRSWGVAKNVAEKMSAELYYEVGTRERLGLGPVPASRRTVVPRVPGEVHSVSDFVADIYTYKRLHRNICMYTWRRMATHGEVKCRLVKTWCCGDIHPGMQTGIVTDRDSRRYIYTIHR